MAELRPRVLIPGGYGVFGSLLARELLATTSVHLVIAGRDIRAAVRFCQHLHADERCEALALDLQDQDAVRRAAAGCFAVVCTAGPFQDLDPKLPKAVAEAGAHWLDISDQDAWVLSVLESAAAVSLAQTVILPGLSTVPALSGILVRWARERVPEAIRARITLYIGNRNQKGPGSIASAFHSEFDDPVAVTLPIGRRLAYRFRSPDAELLRREFGLEVEFRVTFEWRLTNWLLPHLRPGVASRAGRARGLALLSAPFSRFGSDTGCLQAELWAPDGHGVAASFLGKGQRLAILPAALALEALLSGELRQRGSVSPASWLPTEEWIARLGTRGIRFASRRA